MDRRTEYSWNQLALEAAARMSEHDALPKAYRDVSNEHGVAYAREALTARQTYDFMGVLFG